MTSIPNQSVNVWMFHPGQASTTVSQQLKEAKVQDHLATAGEKGKEYSAKGWGFLKSAYASVASGVETVARDNGYKVDLGEGHLKLLGSVFFNQGRMHPREGPDLYTPPLHK